MSLSRAPSPGRRRLLKLGAGAAVVAAVGGGALRWFRFGYAPLLSPAEHPLALSVKEFAVAKAVVEAVTPAEDGLPSGLALGLPQRVDEQVWGAPEGLRDDLQNGLQLLEHGTLLFGYRSRFTALPPAARRACLEAMMGGSNELLRQVAQGLKELVHLLYYSQPQVWAAIGYEGPYVANAVPPASALAYRATLAGVRR